MNPDYRVPAASLAGATPSELVWLVTAPSFEGVRVDDGPDALARQLGALTPGQRALLAIHWCVEETRNGGFDQFFHNPSGLLADEAEAGFRLIGVSEAAVLLVRARSLYADRPSDPDASDPDFDEADDADRFDEYRALFEPLEQQFYALAEEEVSRRAAMYVVSNLPQFVR